MKLRLCCFLFINSLFYAQEQGRLIESIQIRKSRVDIVVNKKFKQLYLLDDFFAEYDVDIDLEKLDRSIVVMPFIMQVIALIWFSGDTYYIESMDEQLYRSLTIIKTIFKRMYPNTLWRGRLVPYTLVKNSYDNFLKQGHYGEVAMLFSGGLDSTYSSLCYRDTKQLLITVWGHGDTPLGFKERWNIIKNKVVSFAQYYKHTNSFITSNYHAFLNRPVIDSLTPEIPGWRWQAIEGLGWIGLVAPLLLSKGYTALIIPSTLSWEHQWPHAANPIIDENVRCSDIQILHDGFDVNRADKHEHIVNVCQTEKLQKPFIRVCKQDTFGGNCCLCEKCIRTMCGFITVSADPCDYGFCASRQRIYAGVKKVLSQKGLTRFTSWNYQCLKEKIKKRYNTQEIKMDPILSQLNSFELSSYKIKEREKPAQKINWAHFTDLYDGIPQRFLPE